MLRRRHTPSFTTLLTFHFCQLSPVAPHVDTPYSSFTTLLPCCRMSRDQRSKDNWALLYACEVAQRSGSNVVVAFNMVKPANAVATLLCLMLLKLAAIQPMQWTGCPLLRNQASKTMSHRILGGHCVHVRTLICLAAVMSCMFCKQRTLRVILKLNHCCHAHSRHSSLHCAHDALCTRKDALSLNLRVEIWVRLSRVDASMGRSSSAKPNLHFNRQA